MVRTRGYCVRLAVSSEIKYLTREEGVRVVERKLKEHHQRFQKLGQVGPVVRSVGLKLGLCKPKKNRSVLVKEKHGNAFNIIGEWKEGVCLVRLVHNRGRVVDHCVLVNAYEDVFMEAAEQVQLTLCTESLKTPGGSDCPALHVAEVLEMVRV